MGCKNHNSAVLDSITYRGQGFTYTQIIRHFAVRERNIEIHAHKYPAALQFKIANRKFCHSYLAAGCSFWSAAATPPLWLASTDSQEEPPLASSSSPKVKAPLRGRRLQTCAASLRVAPRRTQRCLLSDW